MKKIIIALFLVCSFVGQSQTLMPVGPQVTTYSGATRGYHFTAPVAFIISALWIPPDASTGTQDIRVVRFTAGAPPAFAGTTMAYTTLFTCTGVASTTTLSCCIPIAVGDIIGIYGTRSTGCVNSYGNANVATTIMGMPTTLQRSGTQNCIGTLMTWPLPIWSEVAFNIGRIYMFYNNSISTLTAVASQTSICNGTSVAILGGGASSYTWMPGAINTASITVTPTVTTTYTLTGTSLGCAIPQTVSILVNPTPTITANATNSVICLGGSTTLSGAGGSTYSWSGGVVDGVAFSPTVTTTYTVIGTSASGCTNTAVKTITVNPVPSLTINSPSICLGEIATMNATGATTYLWNTGSISNSFTVSPIVNSSYTVTGTSLGCSSSTVGTVYINAPPVVTVNNATICAGQSAILIANGATSYTWSPALTLSSSSGATVTASPLVATVYNITGATGACSNTTTATISITTPPVLSVASATICSGSNTLLMAVGANTYTWSPSGSLSASTGAMVTASPNVTTAYTINGTTIFGCLGSTSATVFVVATPTVSTSSNPSTICLGETSNLSASGATNYLWSPGGATTGALAVTPPITTLYTVIGTNSMGSLNCTASQVVQVTVIPPANIVMSKADTICLGESAFVSATGGDTFNWIPSTGVSSPNSSSTNVKPKVSTTYTVTVSTGGLCPGQSSVQIIVNPLPYVYAGADTTINIDESYILRGTGDVAVGFLSPDGNPLLCNFCPVVEVNPKAYTCYILKGINTFGCESTDEVCIKVTKDYNIYIPNAFTPNGDTDNDIFMPVGYGLESYEMSIFDRWGNLIFKSSAERKGWDGSVKGKICSQGVYVYQVQFTTMGGITDTRTGHLTVLSKVK